MRAYKQFHFNFLTNTLKPKQLKAPGIVFSNIPFLFFFSLIFYCLCKYIDCKAFDAEKIGEEK